MKEIIKIILLCIFIIIITLLMIFSVLQTGFSAFEFLKNAVLTLGNGHIFSGILLTILTLFGLANSVIGIFNPPNFLENAPQWIQNTYLGLSMFGTVALFYLFIEITQ